MPTCDGEFGQNEPGFGPLRWTILILITLLPIIVMVIGMLTGH
jgi:hypothetical protein